MNLTETYCAPLRTPWGQGQHYHRHGKGIVSVSTAGHGGIWLDRERQAWVKHCFPNLVTFAGGNWYEEDCDWAIVALVFSAAFEADAVAAALKTVQINLKWNAESGKPDSWNDIHDWVVAQQSMGKLPKYEVAEVAAS